MQVLATGWRSSPHRQQRQRQQQARSSVSLPAAAAAQQQRQWSQRSTVSSSGVRGAAAVHVALQYALASLGCLFLCILVMVGWMQACEQRGWHGGSSCMLLLAQGLSP